MNAVKSYGAPSFDQNIGFFCTVLLTFCRQLASALFSLFLHIAPMKRENKDRKRYSYTHTHTLATDIRYHFIFFSLYSSRGKKENQTKSHINMNNSNFIPSLHSLEPSPCTVRMYRKLEKVVK